MSRFMRCNGLSALVPVAAIGAAHAAGQSADVAIRGRVEAVEMLGSEQYVHAVVDGGAVTARVPRSQRVRAEDRVTLKAEAHDLHLFERATGRALRQGLFTLCRGTRTALPRESRCDYIFGSVTPCCPWYLPPRSLYDVSQTSSDSKKITCATPSLA